MNHKHIHQTDDAAIIERVATALRVSSDQAFEYIKTYKKPVWFICYRLDVGVSLRAPFATIER